MAGIAAVDGSSVSLAAGGLGLLRSAGAGTSSAGSGATGDFLSFPASYHGFGTNGSAYGTVGVQGGFFSIYAPAIAEAQALSSAVLKPPPPPAQPGSPGDPPPRDPPPGATPNAQQPPPPAGPSGGESSARLQLFASLSDVRARIAYAQDLGNPGAAQQLAPIESQLVGQIDGQTFPGLGNTPIKPFAQPEIPRIFVNISI